MLESPATVAKTGMPIYWMFFCLLYLFEDCGMSSARAPFFLSAAFTTTLAAVLPQFLPQLSGWLVLSRPQALLFSSSAPAGCCHLLLWAAAICCHRVPG